MRGEPNKKWNKRVTKPCPVCGGRVVVAHRNLSWWIRCDDDPFHIKYKPYGDPYSAIRAFNAKTNADRIRAMTDEELAEVIKNPCDMGLHIPNEWCKKRNCGYQCSLDWLKQEAKT